MLRRRDTPPQRSAPLVLALAAALAGPAQADPASQAAAAAVSVQAVRPVGGGKADVSECSGALIAPDLVLTAGHCLDLAADASRVAVFVYSGGKPVPKPLLARAIARHPAHVRGWREKAGDPETLQSEIAADLALIRLAEPVAGAASLGFGPFSGSEGTAAGAGASGPNMRGGTMKRLRLTAIRTSTGSGARVAFASAGATVCGGDSGGPVVGSSGAIWGVVVAVLKPKDGCGTRIAIAPADPSSSEFVRMRASLGAK